MRTSQLITSIPPAYQSTQITRAKGVAYGGTIIARCRFSCFDHVDLPDPDTGGGFLWKFVSGGRESDPKWPLACTCGFSRPLRTAPQSSDGGAPVHFAGGTNVPQATPKASGFPGPALGIVPGDTSRSPVVTADYSSLMNTRPPGGAVQSTSFLQNKDPGASPSRGLSPVPVGMGNLLPLDQPAAAARLNDAASTPGITSSSAPSDQFKYVQDRLRQLAQLIICLKLAVTRNANSASTAECPSAEIRGSPNPSGTSIPTP